MRKNHGEEQKLAWGEGYRLPNGTIISFFDDVHCRESKSRFGVTLEHPKNENEIKIEFASDFHITTLTSERVESRDGPKNQDRRTS